MPLPRLSAVLISLALLAPAAAAAQEAVRCGAFTAAALAPPEARSDANSRERLAEINRAVASEPDRVLFLGDSITERWDPTVWRETLAPRGAVNAGINGDRTEHLLWRLDHGNLDGPAPTVAVLLIGTNDLGHGRPPELAAEGIRAILRKLRARLPATRILLLGLWPREAMPDDRLRREVGAVNRLIAACGDGKNIVYADLGGVLLDADGRLSAAISPDRLHFSRRGYTLLAPPLDTALDRLLGGGR